MKILAIDYGEKHIGLAVSNEKGTIAFPHSIVENNHGLFKTLLALIQEEGIEKVVVGKPEYNKNTASYQSVEKFMRDLAQMITMPVQSSDELLTSETARKSALPRPNSKRRNGVMPRQQKNRHDLAAVFILESYIIRGGMLSLRGRSSND